MCCKKIGLLLRLQNAEIKYCYEHFREKLANTSVQKGRAGFFNVKSIGQIHGHIVLDAVVSKLGEKLREKVTIPDTIDVSTDLVWSPLDPNSYAPPALPFTKPTEKFNLTTVTLWKVAVIDRESSHVFDDTVVAITDEKNESEGRRCLQQYQKKPKKYVPPPGRNSAPPSECLHLEVPLDMAAATTKNVSILGH